VERGDVAALGPRHGAVGYLPRVGLALAPRLVTSGSSSRRSCRRSYRSYIRPPERMSTSSRNATPEPGRRVHAARSVAETGCPARQQLGAGPSPPGRSLQMSWSAERHPRCRSLGHRTPGDLLLYLPESETASSPGDCRALISGPARRSSPWRRGSAGPGRRAAAAMTDSSSAESNCDWMPLVMVSPISSPTGSRPAAHPGDLAVLDTASRVSRVPLSNTPIAVTLPRGC